jgi:hypothetical protein
MCSIEDAFAMFSQGGEDARSPISGGGEERRRKKKRRALMPPEPAVIDPDRPSVQRLPPGEFLGESFESQPSAMLNAYDVDQHFPHPSSDIAEENVYKLDPDWTNVFHTGSAPDWIKDRMPRRETETPLTPSPWMDGQPSLWQSVPDGLRTQMNLGGARTTAEERLDALQRRLDSMFSKLDDMEAGKMANNHMELIMFILGGLFLILILDLLVKQGTQATVLLAAAGGRAFMSGGALLGGKGLLWAN